MPWIALYVCSFGAALVLGAALTLAARRLGIRAGVLDEPGGRKAHSRAVPLSGGWAVFASFLLIAVAGGWLGPILGARLPDSWDPLGHYLRNLKGIRPQLACIVAGSTWIFLVGLVDDVRPLGPRLKLLAQILATVPLIVGGIQIHAFLPWPALGIGLTIGWTVLLMNSFNLLDNMDGLCATVAATIGLVLAIAAAQGGELWLPALFVSFSGILVGFLIFNFQPASIFLGDSGSLLVGYLLAVFSIMITFYGGGDGGVVGSGVEGGAGVSGLPVLIPLAVMGVPLFDTASVIWIRLRAGAPLMVGDQNHFSHRLKSMGFSVRRTVLTIGLLTGATGLASLPLRYLEPTAALLHLLALAMLFGVVAALEFIGRKNAN